MAQRKRVSITAIVSAYSSLLEAAKQTKSGVARMIFGAAVEVDLTGGYKWW